MEMKVFIHSRLQLGPRENGQLFSEESTMPALYWFACASNQLCLFHCSWYRIACLDNRLLTVLFGGGNLSLNWEREREKENATHQRRNFYTHNRSIFVEWWCLSNCLASLVVRSFRNTLSLSLSLCLLTSLGSRANNSKWVFSSWNGKFGMNENKAHMILYSWEIVVELFNSIAVIAISRPKMVNLLWIDCVGWLVVLLILMLVLFACLPLWMIWLGCVKFE